MLATKWVEKGERASQRHHDAPACVCTDWQVPDFSAPPADEVARHMTADLVAVPRQIKPRAPGKRDSDGQGPSA
jgi:hypothetical protein